MIEHSAGQPMGEPEFDLPRAMQPPVCELAAEIFALREKTVPGGPPELTRVEWSDADRNRRLTMHCRSEGEQKVYELQVWEYGGNKPSLTFWARTDEPGISVIDKDGLFLDIPLERASTHMVEYMQMVPIVSKFGVPDKVVDRKFWGIIAQEAFVQAPVRRLLNRLIEFPVLQQKKEAVDEIMDTIHKLDWKLEGNFVAYMLQQEITRRNKRGRRGSGGA